MKELIAHFYASVQPSGKPPVPYREILLTARIVDTIFGQIYSPAERETAPLALPLTR